MEEVNFRTDTSLFEIQINYYLVFLILFYYYCCCQIRLYRRHPFLLCRQYTLIIMTDRAKEYKQINARIMKWREMLDQGLHSDRQLLKKRIKKGVPKSLRIKVWPQLIKCEGKKKQEKFINYNSALLKESNYIHDINMDIARTSSIENEETMRQSLFNVLKALSISFPKIGYCQGMNFLAMRLIEIINDETVYYIFNHIIKKHKSVYENFCNPAFLTRQNQVFMQLLQQHIPKVYHTITQQNIDLLLFTPSWFLTLFSKPLQSQQFYRFFQYFLVEGYLSVYKMGLSLIKVKETQIVENSMEQNLLFIPDNEFYHEICPNLLIELTDEWDFSKGIVNKLEKGYEKENLPKLQTMRRQIKETYQKRLVSPRRKFEWTIEDFRNTRTTLVEFEDD